MRLVLAGLVQASGQTFHQLPQNPSSLSLPGRRPRSNGCGKALADCRHRLRDRRRQVSAKREWISHLHGEELHAFGHRQTQQTSECENFTNTEKMRRHAGECFDVILADFVQVPRRYAA